MRQKLVYKSPLAAMVWSVLLPGFGQLYNKQYFIGVVLIGCEFVVNLNSNLNLALVHSFNGDFSAAHAVIDYRWGMFYPSLYGFAIWQAFNTAKAHNSRVFHQVTQTRTYLSGFFMGLVVGMDFGLFWHDYSGMRQTSMTSFFDMPVFNGLLYGIALGVLGAVVEKHVYRRYKEKLA
jgi:hypothetical protein